MTDTFDCDKKVHQFKMVFTVFAIFFKAKKFITSIEFKNNGPVLLLKTIGTETVSCCLLLRMERWT